MAVNVISDVVPQVICEVSERKDSVLHLLILSSPPGHRGLHRLSSALASEERQSSGALYTGRYHFNATVGGRVEPKQDSGALSVVMFCTY